MGALKVLDLGCNVSPRIKKEGSLRYQMELQGVQYIGLDISYCYFSKTLSDSANVYSGDIYQQVQGVVGDIKTLPIKTQAFELITCADVIEHVPNPDQAFNEIARILTDNGRALIVLPSMYKLDIGNYPHIYLKRKSSHERKLTALDWKKKWESAGLLADLDKSKPIGLASGLSYLAWLSDEYVPERQKLNGEETYSEKSHLHLKAKSILSKYDPQIDQQILANPEISQFIINGMETGDLQAIFYLLQNITHELQPDKEELQILNSFFNSVSSNNFDSNRVTELQSKLKQHDNPLFLIGNSILVVLRKK